MPSDFSEKASGIRSKIPTVAMGISLNYAVNYLIRGGGVVARDSVRSIVSAAYSRCSTR